MRRTKFEMGQVKRKKEDRGRKGENEGGKKKKFFLFSV